MSFDETGNDTLAMDDRRSSARLSGDPEVTYFVSFETESGERLCAGIVDESKTGIAILIGNADRMKVGDVLPFIYRCTNLRGEIKYISRQSCDEFRVGVEWLQLATCD